MKFLERIFRHAEAKRRTLAMRFMNEFCNTLDYKKLRPNITYRQLLWHADQAALRVVDQEQRAMIQEELGTMRRNLEESQQLDTRAPRLKYDYTVG